MVHTHELIKAFRNQTIAHSQSQLAVTYPVGVLNGKTMELQYVSAVTLVSTLPPSIAKDFAILISTVMDLIDEVLDPVRRRLEQLLRAADRDALVAAPPLVIEAMADAFQPRSKRPRHPNGHTIYWDRDDDRLGSGLEPDVTE